MKDFYPVLLHDSTKGKAAVALDKVFASLLFQLAESSSGSAPSRSPL